MAMGKREAVQQQDLFITHDKLPRSPGHVFYRKLNQVLAEGGFDRWVEALCEPHHCQGEGRPSIPPGVYFRFVWVLALLHKKKLLQGKTVGVDSTTLEADAATKSIVRKDCTDDDASAAKPDAKTNLPALAQADSTRP